MAVQLERRYSKDRILELYLNAIYFGNGAYGIEAAAQQYFGKPRGPAHPGRGRAARRPDPAPERHRPLRRPRAGRRPAQRRARADAREPLRHRCRGRRRPDASRSRSARPPRRRRSATPAAYFVEEVKQWILDDPRFGATAQDATRPAVRRRAAHPDHRRPRRRRPPRRRPSTAILPDPAGPAASLVSIEPGHRATSGPWSAAATSSAPARTPSSTWPPRGPARRARPSSPSCWPPRSPQGIDPRDRSSPRPPASPSRSRTSVWHACNYGGGGGGAGQPRRGHGALVQHAVRAADHGRRARRRRWTAADVARHPQPAAHRTRRRARHATRSRRSTWPPPTPPSPTGASTCRRSSSPGSPAPTAPCSSSTSTPRSKVLDADVADTAHQHPRAGDRTRHRHARPQLGPARRPARPAPRRSGETRGSPGTPRSWPRPCGSGSPRRQISMEPPATAHPRHRRLVPGRDLAALHAGGPRGTAGGAVPPAADHDHHRRTTTTSRPRSTTTTTPRPTCPVVPDVLEQKVAIAIRDLQSAGLPGRADPDRRRAPDRPAAVDGAITRWRRRSRRGLDGPHRSAGRLTRLDSRGRRWRGCWR